MGAEPLLDQWNLLISGGFQAQTGAEPPPGQIPEYAPDYGIILNINYVKLKNIWRETQRKISSYVLMGKTIPFHLGTN